MRRLSSRPLPQWPHFAAASEQSSAAFRKPSAYATTCVSPVPGLPLARPLWFADYKPKTKPAGRILLLGGIHGDEYSSVTILFKWMAALEAVHSQAVHWRLMPLLNPDGLLQGTSQRTNSNGVDLNRNFPTPNWESEATDYWARRTGKNPRRYPGPRPLSEPESRFLLEEIDRFQPHIIVSVHAPLEAVDYDGPNDPPENLGSLYLKRMGTYPGSLGRYGSEELHLPVVTIELSRAGTMPSREEQRLIWSDLSQYVERTLGSGATSQASAPSTDSQ